MRAGCQIAIVYAVTNGYLNDVPINKVKEYEAMLYAKLENEYSALLDRFESGFYEEEDIEILKEALLDMKR